MQDPNPLPWGAQDRFQAHFIVQQDSGEKVIDFTARTRLKTTGHFGSKKVIGVTWEGGKLAEDEMINKLEDIHKLIMVKK